MATIVIEIAAARSSGQELRRQLIEARAGFVMANSPSDDHYHMIDGVPMEDRDTKGDLYEYMLGKIASAGQNGQFRTPRHIIQLMVELTAPTAKDVICDPACGTGGFLVSAFKHILAQHTSSPRPSPPSNGGEGVHSVAALPLCVSPRSPRLCVKVTLGQVSVRAKSFGVIPARFWVSDECRLQS
jgi:hypothetical protein